MRAGCWGCPRLAFRQVRENRIRPSYFFEFPALPSFSEGGAPSYARDGGFW